MPAERATTATTSPAATGMSSTSTANASWSRWLQSQSPQEDWLEPISPPTAGKNVIAIWHKPRYSSGVTNMQALQPLWDDLYAAGVDLLLDGHDHIYERTEPIGPAPALDPPVADRPTASTSSRSDRRRSRAELRAGTDTSQVRNDRLRRPQADPPRHHRRLEVPAGRRQHLHRAGTGSVHAAPPVPNQAPVAVADTHTTPEGTALNVAAPGVLGNDTDADRDPMSAVLDANVSHGSLTLDPNGSFLYTPTNGYSGPDSFTYHANDGTLTRTS